MKQHPINRRYPMEWADIQGKAPYPLVGEDAQIWLSRNRRDETENRELHLRSNYENVY